MDASEGSKSMTPDPRSGLLAQLRAYLQHKPECDVTAKRWRRVHDASRYWVKCPCTCGLDALIGSLPPDVKGTPHANRPKCASH